MNQLNANPVAVAPHASFRPRVLCRHFQRGSCSRGSTCTFLNEGPAQGNRNIAPCVPRDQRVACVHFQRGYCRHGDRCVFRHDLSERRRAQPPVPPVVPVPPRVPNVAENDDLLSLSLVFENLFRPAREDERIAERQDRLFAAGLISAIEQNARSIRPIRLRAREEAQARALPVAPPPPVAERVNVVAAATVEDDDGEKEIDAQNTVTCVICLDAPSNATLVHFRTQVGHRCCCTRCANELRRQGHDCPLCRQNIDAVIKVF